MRSIPIHELLPYPPFQPGWFRQASARLVSQVVEHGESTKGAPFQFRLSHSSAIVAVNTMEDSILLKGVTAGSPEIEITTAVVKLFPRYSPELVSVNEKLRSFTTRGFIEGGAGRGKRIEMLQMLGKTQRESVEHVVLLMKAGVPSLKLKHTEETLKTWAEDAAFLSAVEARLLHFTDPFVGYNDNSIRNIQSADVPSSWRLCRQKHWIQIFVFKGSKRR